MNTQSSSSNNQQTTSSSNNTKNLNTLLRSNHRRVVRRRRRKKDIIRIDYTSVARTECVRSSKEKVIKTNLLDINKYKRFNFVQKPSNDINFKRTELNSKRVRLQKDMKKYSEEIDTLKLALKRNNFIRNKIEHKIQFFEKISGLLLSIDKVFKKIFFATFHSTNRDRRISQYLKLEKELIDIKRKNKKISIEQRFLSKNVPFSFGNLCSVCWR